MTRDRTGVVRRGRDLSLLVLHGRTPLSMPYFDLRPSVQYQ